MNPLVLRLRMIGMAALLALPLSNPALHAKDSPTPVHERTFEVTEGVRPDVAPALDPRLGPDGRELPALRWYPSAHLPPVSEPYIFHYYAKRPEYPGAVGNSERERIGRLEQRGILPPKWFYGPQKPHPENAEGHRGAYMRSARRLLPPGNPQRLDDAHLEIAIAVDEWQSTKAVGDVWQAGWEHWNLDDHDQDDTFPQKTFASRFGDFQGNPQVRVTAIHRSDRRTHGDWGSGGTDGESLDGVELENLRRSRWTGWKTKGALLDIDGLTAGTYVFRLYNNNKAHGADGKLDIADGGGGFTRVDHNDTTDEAPTREAAYLEHTFTVGPNELFQEGDTVTFRTNSNARLDGFGIASMTTNAPSLKVDFGDARTDLEGHHLHPDNPYGLIGSIQGMIDAKALNPELFIMVYWRGEKTIAPALRHEAVDLLVIEGALLKRGERAREHGYIDRTVFMQGYLNGGDDLETVENRIREIRERFPEMPGMALYTGGGVPASYRNDDENWLRGFDELLRKYFVDPAPEVYFAAPRFEASLDADRVTLEAGAEGKDGRGIRQYRWFVDNRLIAETDEPVFEWDTTREWPGRHMLTVHAIDEDWNRAASQIPVRLIRP